MATAQSCKVSRSLSQSLSQSLAGALRDLASLRGCAHYDTVMWVSAVSNKRQLTLNTTALAAVGTPASTRFVRVELHVSSRPWAVPRKANTHINDDGRADA